MPDKRHLHKNTKAYPLGNSGAFTWNTKTRQLIFMRAGNPKSDRPEMRLARGFYVEGDDIKHLYQVLHAHFMEPRNVTRNWSDDLPEPQNAFAERHNPDPPK